MPPLFPELQIYRISRSGSFPIEDTLAEEVSRPIRLMWNGLSSPLNDSLCTGFWPRRTSGSSHG